MPKEIPKISSKYVAKKSATFSPKEIAKVFLHLQENISSKSTLYGKAISLLYFGLLGANKVRDVVVDDVALVKEGGNPGIKVAFAQDTKRQNIGFKFYVLHQYYPMYDCYMKELCTEAVNAGKMGMKKENVTLKIQENAWSTSSTT